MKPHLRDELRAARTVARDAPAHTVGERRRLLLEGLEPGDELAQRRPGEAGADLPRVTQRARRVVHADEQGAEADAGALGRR